MYFHQQLREILWNEAGREETKENEKGDEPGVCTVKKVTGTRASNVEAVSKEDTQDLPIRKFSELCQRGSSVIQ